MDPRVFGKAKKSEVRKHMWCHLWDHDYIEAGYQMTLGFTLNPVTECVQKMKKSQLKAEALKELRTAGVFPVLWTVFWVVVRWWVMKQLEDMLFNGGNNGKTSIEKEAWAVRSAN